MEHGRDSDNPVSLICSEFNCLNPDDKLHDSYQITISTSEISNWNLPSILSHKVLTIEVNPHRLIEESSYFRGLLGGSFSESCLDSVSIEWSVESFVTVLRIVYGCEVEISSDNFIPLNEAALFFGVDKLLDKCRLWLAEVTSYTRHQSPQLLLDDLIRIWKYGLEHANDFILQLCTSYLARNFMWALSFNCYADVPYKLLYSCIRHPDLTVESERRFADAILVWLNVNAIKSEDWSSNDLCRQIQISLLPIWFVAGKQRCRFFANLADEATGAILRIQRHHPTALPEISRQGELSQIRVRLTKYTQKVDISGCPQITTELFPLSVHPSPNADRIMKKISKMFSIDHVKTGGDDLKTLLELGQITNFEGVQELDISNCPSYCLESAIEILCKSFPSLRSLRAAYFLNFNSKKLHQLVQKFPLLTIIDLTLDVDPVIPAQVSVMVPSSVLTPEKPTALYDIYNRQSTASLSNTISRPLPSNIRKLTLEGRTEITDSELLSISEVCCSLSYVNIKGCTLVTDHGISRMILNCKELCSILACDTSFGNHSALALCSSNPNETQESENYSRLMAHKLLILHIGRCRGIAENNLSELLSKSDNLRSLCLRETQLLDISLYKFSGAALEMLDVSDTKVSSAALLHVISRNPELKSLRTRGCSDILHLESETKLRKSWMSKNTLEELYAELGKSCKLEELELGWGFSYFSLGALKQGIETLRTLVVGLGGSLGPDGLELLPLICPMLETLILYFQVISDSAIINIIQNLQHLQILALSYCFGGISLLSFKTRIPNLRSLKLERVTPWMTNEELAILAKNCAALVALSLVGCPLLDFEAQRIISSGWPGLTSLHLEECGELSVDGVTSLLDCHALEDLTIRHSGPGIARDFIIHAASRLPMLRKVSIDVCDAKDGDFDLPSFGERCSLRSVKIARCKLQKSALELHNLEGRRTPVHKETLVLFWDSRKLVTRVVKERL
ncbi:BTB/POZ domain-containing protein FBL11-like [Salvia divinorum]|uniref:BTB/POZ domain-containing protein FBL11-like n=1 Tax=Salvia divinorum TaxID=28513 RepID=A0ABD1GCD8_SALDI